MTDAIDLKFKLHPKQYEVFTDPARFKVCVAGRRFGKSHLAVAYTLTEALKNELNGYPLAGKGVFYAAPTFDQGKRIAWQMMKQWARPVIKRVKEQTGRLELINDRFIEIRGTDRPETMLGVGLSAVVLDEYADMKPMVWEQILRPTLADVKGSALFIGTPRGKNHFYELWKDHEKDKEWALFQFTSFDNPYLDPEEIEASRRDMSSALFRQEHEAKFVGGGSGKLKEEWLRFSPEPLEGSYVMAVDLAGFIDRSDSASKYIRTDETAIVIVKIHRGGWHISDIRHGHWGVRECAVRILQAAHDYKIMRFGIEKGALMNAAFPYLQERMQAINFFPMIIPLIHGGKHKSDRIDWALAGRFEHGKVTMPERAGWVPHFVEQYLDFPNPKARDDLLDATAYIAQLAAEDGSAVAYSMGEPMEDSNYFTPIDQEAGY